MKQIALLILAGVVVSAATAWTTVLLIGPDRGRVVGSGGDGADQRGSVDGPPVDPVVSPGADLGPELDLLRQDLAELRLRIERLEGRTQRLPISVPPGDTVGGPRTAAPGAASPEVTELRAQVAEALEDIRKQEAVQKVQADLSRRSAQIDERLAGMTKWLGLDGVQAARLRAILVTKDEQDRQLVKQWEDGVDPQVLGETKRTNHETWLISIEQLLTPDQLETFRTKFRPPAEEPGGGKGGK
ncbi:MAG: hypothetical protein R3F30_08015 [Planctomycetota bacterium]